MVCNLYKDKKETLTHYIGFSGNEYPFNEYQNWGSGGTYKGKKDLPKDEYPYTYKYTIDPAWKFCRTCNCEGKDDD